MLNGKAKKQLENLVDAFRTGEIGQVVERTVIPLADVPCAKWSLCNRVIVSLSGTDDARGYRQWKEVGRYVKKGSKAIYILVPWYTKKPTEDAEEKDGERMLRGFMSAPVFRFEDTDGEPIDRPQMEPPELPSLFEVAERFDVKVRWQGHLGRAYGTFRPGEKEITLESHDEPVFWHELAHAAHQRVNGTLKDGQDPKQEAVAELSATVIAGLYGSDWSGNCWRYIQRYSGDPLGLCLSVLAEVEKVLGEILTLEDGYDEGGDSGSAARSAHCDGYPSSGDSGGTVRARGMVQG